MATAIKSVGAISTLKGLHITEQPTSSIGVALDVVRPERRRNGQQQKKIKKIALPTADGFCFEPIKEITYLEASGNYTIIHFADQRRLLVCRSLGELEGQLKAFPFVRIHRSHSIHLRHLRQYIRGKGGAVVLGDGVSLAVSAGQKDELLYHIQEYFS
jgi:two-component system, LytTR family, response regulator